MGCYIHAFVEVVADEDAKCFAYLNMEQNYSLFALMANVRNSFSEECIKISVFRPKGLPRNISHQVKEKYKEFGFKEDSFAHSWLTVEELKKVQKRYIVVESDEDRELAAIIAMMEKLQFEDHLKPRLVFWFD